MEIFACNCSLNHIDFIVFLFYSSSSVQTSRGKKRAHPSSALAPVEPKSRGHRELGFRHFSAPASPSQPPLCRPWDRGDLMRRVATFKSMTWFAKPKVRIPPCNYFLAIRVGFECGPPLQLYSSF